MKKEELNKESIRVRLASHKALDEAEAGKFALQANALKAVSTSIANLEVSGKERRELSETEVETVIRKQVKNRREAAAIYSEAGDTDRATSETIEADYLEGLLPKQLTDDEVEVIVTEIIESENLSSMGLRGVGMVMKAVKNRSDINPATASRIAKEKLS